MEREDGEETEDIEEMDIDKDDKSSEEEKEKDKENEKVKLNESRKGSLPFGIGEKIQKGFLRESSRKIKSVLESDEEEEPASAAPFLQRRITKANSPRTLKEPIQSKDDLLFLNNNTNKYTSNLKNTTKIPVDLLRQSQAPAHLEDELVVGAAHVDVPGLLPVDRAEVLEDIKLRKQHKILKQSVGNTGLTLKHPKSIVKPSFKESIVSSDFGPSENLFDAPLRPKTTHRPFTTQLEETPTPKCDVAKTSLMIPFTWEDQEETTMTDRAELLSQRKIPKLILEEKKTSRANRSN
eukprot:TRINITY_DN598_c1_g3_i1.p1 TRINITY_DN598_c1_g3~~TRINITY_DN598_c1_g3_i1.p1  ORF type:complete len:294 (-),score=90.66 TRINITY_DN598_c1_g3_i1:376-1257(-)